MNINIQILSWTKLQILFLSWKYSGLKDSSYQKVKYFDMKELENFLKIVVFYDNIVKSSSNAGWRKDRKQLSFFMNTFMNNL